MKQLILFQKVLFILSISLGITACKRTDLSKIAAGALSPTLAIPIGKASFGVYDVLAKNDSTSLVAVGSQGELKLVYDVQTDLLSAKDLIIINDQSYEYNRSALDYGFPISPSYSGTSSAAFNETVSFDNLNGFELTSVEFFNGLVNLDVSTTLQHNVTIQITFPDLKINGVAVSRTLVMDNPPAPQSANANVDLTSAILDLTQGGQGNNELRIQGSITVQGASNPILGVESINISAGFQDLEFELVRGNVGTIDPISLKDSIEIAVFKNFTGGEVQFTNPSIQFEATNSFGIPMEINFNEIKTVATNTGNEVSLIGFPITFPITAPASPGGSNLSTLLLNSSNTQNISTIISPTPKHLVFDIGGELNPNNTTQNFITKTSNLSLKVDLELPLEGYAKNFRIKDTIPFALDVPEEEATLTFRIISDNGFPIEIGADFLVADENYNVIADLNPGNNTILKGAKVNAQGRATTKEKNITEIVLEGGQSSILRKGKYLIISVYGETTNGSQNQVVKFFDDYALDLKLAMKIEGKLKL
ncbi:MAG: hypothetical protein KJ941_02100 [Bacteroidetes bacterium]|nr:hypothetical protein [Bacteroidota bacterium]